MSSEKYRTTETNVPLDTKWDQISTAAQRQTGFAWNILNRVDDTGDVDDEDGLTISPSEEVTPEDMEYFHRIKGQLEEDMRRKDKGDIAARVKKQRRKKRTRGY